MTLSPTPRLRHRLEHALYRGAERLVSSLPWATVLELGRALGLLFWLVDTRHRRIIRKNLSSVDLGLDDRAIHRISKACFAHYGAVFLTTLRLYASDPEEGDCWMRVEGLEHVDAAQALGRGVIGFSGHYSNWEAVGFVHARAGRFMSVIARGLENPLLERALRASREAEGNTMIPKGGAIRETVKALGQGRSVGFLIDQDALTAGIWVKFLGQWASTYSTAGNLAVRLGCPVLPIFSTPEEDGGIRVRIGPALQVPDTGDLERDTWVAMQLMTTCLEAQVRRDPRWYFWMHNRFKTRPGEGNPLPAPLPPQEWVESIPTFSV